MKGEVHLFSPTLAKLFDGRVLPTFLKERLRGTLLGRILIWIRDQNRWISYRFRCFYLWIQRGFKTKRMLCYPDLPGAGHIIFTIAKISGYSLTRNANSHADLVLHWKDQTFREFPAILVNHRDRVMNLHCNDISKEKIERIFKEVFQYGSFIDPEKHVGKCVRKSNLNSRFLNKIVDCPMAERKQGFVYQRLINNKVENIF